MTREHVHFRLLHLPCCGQLLCWVNPRLPNYCPECGTLVLAQLRTGEHHRLEDRAAELRLTVDP